MGNDTATTVKPNELQGKITAVTVKVGNQPVQKPVQNGFGNLTMTTYLPVTISQTIDLSGENNNSSSNNNITAATIKPGSFLRLYPVYPSWEGKVLIENKYSILDKDRKPIEFRGFNFDTLLLLNATCDEPFPSRINYNDTLTSEDKGVIIQNTTKPVPSSINYGNSISITFEKQQLLPNSKIYYIDEGWGIVPANYAEKISSISNQPAHNGAGNKEVAGKYHLSFVSFYNTTTELPKSASILSSHQVACTLNSNNQNYNFPQQVFVYDIWFEMKNGG